MNTKKPIRKERLLAYSWLAAYMLFGLIIATFGRNNLMDGEPAFQLATPLFTGIVCVIMFVFIPWLYIVRIHAKKTGWKPVVAISTVFLCLLTLWVIMASVLTILALSDVIELS